MSSDQNHISPWEYVYMCVYLYILTVTATAGAGSWDESIGAEEFGTVFCTSGATSCGDVPGKWSLLPRDLHKRCFGHLNQVTHRNWMMRSRLSLELRTPEERRILQTDRSHPLPLQHHHHRWNLPSEARYVHPMKKTTRVAPPSVSIS